MLCDVCHGLFSDLAAHQIMVLLCERKRERQGRREQGRKGGKEAEK